VSFQARDITGKSPFRYLACPAKREKIPHKTILYGHQEVWVKYNTIIVVEGVTDVWRLGEIAAATFGIEFKTEQVIQLSKHADNFFILYDNEPRAQQQARKLAVKLSALNKKVEVVTVDTDPGDMKQEDADYFVKQLVPSFTHRRGE